MIINDNDFRTWTQDDYRYNIVEAFDAKNYPEAKYRYLKDSGCLVIALAIMLRMFDIEKEADYNKFNPLIFLERAKVAGCFNIKADFIFTKISKLYPIEQFECVPYTKEALVESLKKGYASILMVPGKNDLYHYIVPDKILDNDVLVIDHKFNKTHISQYEKVYYIVNFRKISF